MDGCPHCANLESMLSSANIQFVTTTSGSCACYPCATLCDGSTVSSCGGNAEYDVLASIKASIASGTQSSPTPTPIITPIIIPPPPAFVPVAYTDPAAPTPYPSSGTSNNTTPGTNTDVYVTTTDSTPPWKTSDWSNIVTIDWGQRNPRPAIAEEPVDWMSPDIQLTPVLPLPPIRSTGITIALRDHKKMPKGRKIA